MAEARLSPLTDPSGFLESWDNLLNRAGNTTFFQSTAWMKAWLDDIPEAVSIYHIEVREGETIQLLGAIGRPHHRSPPFFGLSQSRLHEVGVTDNDAIYIEYNDFLVTEGADKARALAIDALIEGMPEIENFVFRNATQNLASALEKAAASRGLKARPLNDQPVYIADLAENRRQNRLFLDGVSKSLSTKVRRAINLYEARGQLVGKEPDSQIEIDHAWNTLIELHEAGWKRRQQAGVFANAQLTAFHERLRGHAPDQCRLFEVTCGSNPIGVLYNFVCGERAINYQSGFRYEDDNKLTPGFVCHALACQYYQDKGFAFYDFLAGDAEYKRRFGRHAADLKSISLDRHGWRQSLRSLVRR